MLASLALNGDPGKPKFDEANQYNEPMNANSTWQELLGTAASIAMGIDHMSEFKNAMDQLQRSVSTTGSQQTLSKANSIMNALGSAAAGGAGQAAGDGASGTSESKPLETYINKGKLYNKDYLTFALPNGAGLAQRSPCPILSLAFSQETP